MPQSTAIILAVISLAGGIWAGRFVSNAIRIGRVLIPVIGKGLTPIYRTIQPIIFWFYVSSGILCSIGWILLATIILVGAL